MRRQLLSVIPIMLIVLLVISAQGQTAKKKRTVANPAATTEDVQQLKDLVSSQQKQMEAEHQQVEQLRSQLQQLVDATQQANAAAQKAQATTDQGRRLHKLRKTLPKRSGWLIKPRKTRWRLRLASP